MRRKPNALVPIEEAICRAALALRLDEIEEFHGYELAKQLADAEDRKQLTAYGTLYRALGRLEAMGMLQSRREDPEVAAQANRPGRRLYTLTALGEAAARAVVAAPEKRVRRTRRRVAPA
jgi:PadR family transcriptional regulator, regulatory protein PadR